MMLNVIGTTCHYDDCHFAECHCAEYDSGDCHYADGHYPECHFADWRYVRSVFTPHVVHLSTALTLTQNCINDWFNKMFFIRLDSGKFQVNLWLPNPQTSNISILLILALVLKLNTLCKWCWWLQHWGWFMSTTKTVKFCDFKI